MDLDTGGIETPVVFRDFGLPYRLLRRLHIRLEAKVRLEAGVEFVIADGEMIEVGGGDGSELLICDGTAQNKVVFRGATPKAGAWMGIIVRGGSSAGTRFTHTVIRHGGYDERPSLDIERTVKIDHLRVEDALNGVSIWGGGATQDSTRLEIKNTKGYAFRFRPQTIMSLPDSIEFENNERSLLWMYPGILTQSGTIRKRSVPYHIDDRVRLNREVELEVAPGVEFQMGNDAELDLRPYGPSSRVVMKGTPSETIKFYGEKPTVGYWGSVRVGKTLESGSAFEHVEFSHGGSKSKNSETKKGMLELDRAFPVKRCSFSKSGGYGILRRPDDDTNYTTDNAIRDNKDGDVGK